MGGAHPPFPPNITHSGEYSEIDSGDNSEVDVATNCHSGEHRDEICVRIDHSLAG